MDQSNVTQGKVVMLPAPTWAGVPRDPTITATGGVISARAKNPDAAWEVYDYYMGRKPAQDRAKSGWGVPALKSFYEMMPTGTPLQQQAQKVVQEEIGLGTPPLKFNPYLSETALNGDIPFTEMVSRVQGEVNTLITEGKSRIGG